jgi:hypothetical protein
LCQLDVSGPADCPLVYLVMTDEDLRAQLQSRRLTHGRSTRQGEDGAKTGWSG